MISYYIKAKRQEKFARFAETFATIAALFGVLACLVAFSYQAGRNAGIVSGVELVRECEQDGASGYIVNADGVICLYE